MSWPIKERSIMSLSIKICHWDNRPTSWSIKIGRWEIRWRINYTKRFTLTRKPLYLPASWNGSRDRVRVSTHGVDKLYVAEMFLFAFGPLFLRRRAKWRLWSTPKRK